jgi:hypothetical protein
MNDLERARLYTGRTQAERDVHELRALRGRLCGDRSCARPATVWRRDGKGHWAGRCAIHGARNGLQRRQAQLNELRGT